MTIELLTPNLLTNELLTTLLYFFNKWTFGNELFTTELLITELFLIHFFYFSNQEVHFPGVHIELNLNLNNITTQMNCPKVQLSNQLSKSSVVNRSVKSSFVKKVTCQVFICQGLSFQEFKCLLVNEANIATHFDEMKMTSFRVNSFCCALPEAISSS